MSKRLFHLLSALPALEFTLQDHGFLMTVCRLEPQVECYPTSPYALHKTYLPTENIKKWVSKPQLPTPIEKQFQKLSGPLESWFTIPGVQLRQPH